MTSSRAFVIEREIRIQAPRERVFELLTAREGFPLWMPVVILEPRIGGKVEFRFVPEAGSEKVTFGEITAYDPPARIAFTLGLQRRSPRCAHGSYDRPHTAG